MKKTIRVLINLPVLITFLLVTQSVESRMLYSDVIFKAKHNEDTIYGTWNALDNRICAVIRSKAIFGRMSNDGKSAILAGKRINIIDAYPSNYAFNLHLSKKWWDNPQSKKCTNYTSYGQCFVHASVPYYLNDPDEPYTLVNATRKYRSNPRLRKIFKTRTTVFVEAGIDNNSASRDGVEGLWRNFSFDPKEISFDSMTNLKFLISEDKLICKGKK